MTQGNASEIARLMRQIADEYEAAQRGLSGLAITAKHQFLTARQENIARYHEQLKQLVGEPGAIQLVVQSMEGAND